jgi:uncharacterized protein DUF2637
MTRIGKLWTGAVAYVSLLVGAGLSVAGNLADTYRTRGADVDGLDKVMAAGWPILVLLAIEMFVSPRWSPSRMFQVWRWIGCLAVGGMAMVVSWTHLHDLMASRGQLFVVTVLGPLAIDGMAIMATGLILSTRVRGQVATDTFASGSYVRTGRTDNPWTDEYVPADRDRAADKDRAALRKWAADMATDTFASDVMSADKRMGDKIAGLADMSASGPGRWADLVTPDTDADMSATRRTEDADNAVPATDTLRADTAKLNALSAFWSSADDRLVQDLLTGTDAPRLPQRTRAPGASYPAEFADMVAVWDPIELDRADLIKLAASHFEVSTRTARRWLAAVLGEPTSGAGS